MFQKPRIPLLFLLALSLLGSPVKAGGGDEAPRKHRTPIYTAGGQDECLHCHSGESMRAIAGSAHGDESKLHSPAARQGCESCHGPGSIHISRAHGGRGFPPLTTFGRGKNASGRDEQLKACLACHGSGDLDVSQVVFSGSPHDRRTINCSSCHTAHAVSDRMRDREQQFSTCSRCHKRQIENHPEFRGRRLDFGSVSCAACHDVHSPVLDPVESIDGEVASE